MSAEDLMKRIEELGRTVEHLQDREKVRDSIMRYANGVDRCDEEMIRSCIWPDGRINIGDLDGSGAQFVAWVLEGVKRLECTQHFVGNIAVRVDGNTAKSETYLRNWHTLRRDSGELYDLVHGGRYLDTHEKRDGEWRIMHRYVMWDFAMETAKTMNFKDGVLGQKNLPLSGYYPDDQMYKLYGGLSTKPFS